MKSVEEYFFFTFSLQMSEKSINFAPAIDVK